MKSSWTVGRLTYKQLESYDRTQEIISLLNLGL